MNPTCEGGVGVIVLSHPEVHELAMGLRGKTPAEILNVTLRCLPKAAFACSFGVEDMALLDMLVRVRPDTTVFYLDTDLLFPETYALRDAALARYRPRGLKGFMRVSPEWTLSEQARLCGDELWKRDPNLCCEIRKVRPLERVLSQFECWITGIRRDQTPARANSEVVEIDERFDLVKVNPLAFWTSEQVWDYVRAYDVPYNRLHDEGYPSIGCIHCTRPVAPGQDARSGRWQGFTKTECGLHVR